MPGESEMDGWEDELLQDWGFAADSIDPGTLNVGIAETSEFTLTEMGEGSVATNPG